MTRTSPTRRRAALVLALSLALPLACNPNSQNVIVAQQVTELGDALNDVRQENAQLQNQIDSLRAQVARQDTVLRRISNLAGVPVP